jgi:hypothetical protein
MSKVFPNTLKVADGIQKSLVDLIESKIEIQRGVLDLARIVNENLKRKISGFPEAIQRERDAEAAKLASENNKRTVQTVSRTTTSSQRNPAPKSTTSGKEATQEPSSKPS